MSKLTEDSPEVEAAKAYVTQYMREAMSKHLGAPVNIEAIKATMATVLNTVLQELKTAKLDVTPLDRVKDAWISLATLGWGVGSPKQCCDHLKKLATPDVEWLFKRIGGGPGNMLFLERSVREGTIKGWTVTSEQLGPDGNCVIEIEPNFPIERVAGLYLSPQTRLINGEDIDPNEPVTTNTESETEQLWWLSFADASLPTGAQFLGAAIVRGCDMISAVCRAHKLGINPGGEVKGAAIPADMQIPSQWIERLLNRQECEQFDSGAIGKEVDEN